MDVIISCLFISSNIKEEGVILIIPRGIKLVVYDADNTLYDMAKSNVARLSEVGRRIGLGEVTEEQYWSVMNLPIDGMLKVLFPKKLAEAKKAYKQVGKYIELIKIEAGLIETLSELSSRGLRLGVATNRHETSLRMIFDRFPEVASFFNPRLVFSLQDERIAPCDRRFPNTFQKCKPDPQCLEMAMMVTALSPRKILYIGDTPDDQRTARSAGVHFIGYERCETEFGCITIHDHQELLSFF